MLLRLPSIRFIRSYMSIYWGSDLFCSCYPYFFLSDSRKKKDNKKERLPSALFELFQSGIPLKEKNSLRSNSFSFLTLHTSPFISRSKSEAGHSTQHCFARWSGCFYVFYYYRSFWAKGRIRTKSSHQHISSKSHKKTKTNNERSDVYPPSSPPTSQGPAFSGGAWRKMEIFPWRTKSCLSEASSFRLGNGGNF